jgi:hypothetical protein
MNAIAPIADKLGKLIRLLSSDRDGEVLGAAYAIKRALKTAGLDVHALAQQIEKPAFNEADAKKLYDAGYQSGYQATAATQSNNDVTFHDISSPLATWHETARWCQQRNEQLRSREREFVDQMCGETLWRAPTDKQGRWLKSIYYTLGGR